MINAKTQMENAGGWTVAGRGGEGQEEEGPEGFLEEVAFS